MLPIGRFTQLGGVQSSFQTSNFVTRSHFLFFISIYQQIWLNQLILQKDIFIFTLSQPHDKFLACFFDFTNSKHIILCIPRCTHRFIFTNIYRFTSNTLHDNEVKYHSKKWIQTQVYQCYDTNWELMQFRPRYSVYSQF